MSGRDLDPEEGEEEEPQGMCPLVLVRTGLSCNVWWVVGKLEVVICGKV